MQYTTFGKDKVKISRFGMGCMRLPFSEVDGKYAVDEAESVRMIRYAVEHGVNYFDTAYPYCGGKGEIIVGNALKDGYRERVNLTTKLPCWFVKKEEDFERLLDEQLNKLQVEYLDFYLIHHLSKNNWENISKFDVAGFFDNMKKKGKIKYAGFSFHDNTEVFKNILDSYDWDVCQIQLNILDENYQAGVEGLKYAGSKNVPVIIMEPLKGGCLANEPHKEVSDIYNKAPVKRSHIEWAFRWLYNFPEIMTILSGVSTLEQLNENIRIFEDAAPNCMTEEEIELVRQVKKVYEEKIKVGCTGCRYCMPCPNRVHIANIFDMYNSAYVYNDLEKSIKRYDELIRTGEKQGKRDVSFCIECGKCERACPQNLPVIEKLKEADKVLRGK